jgi:prephenate dehydrogenase
VQRIAIIGLGLIGGSIALALKQAGLKDVRIVGNARTGGTLRRARQMGAIDEEAPTPADAVHDAGLVIIAAPIMATRHIFAEIATALADGAVVTDASSTKSEVMRWADELLPRNVFFVGGHPMAGKETQGIEAAEARLFRGKTWVITPGAFAPERAVQTVAGLVEACGANAVFMDADEHDSYVAAISHLPLTLATALFSVANKSAAWPELAGLASSGFRDTTRLASGSTEMAHDIVMTNRDNLLHWIDRFQEELTRIRATIRGGESSAVFEEFARAQIERENFITSGAPKRDIEGPKLEGISVGDMLLGTKLSGYLKRSNEIVKEAEAREKKR